MQSQLGVVPLALALALALPCHAQEVQAPKSSIEPKVELLVTEDDNVRIEELRVRGQVQRILVTPKRGAGVAYQILTGDGSNSQAAGPNATRGALGQRVWHVLSF
jgi:Protein of unknown function (DUF2782)